jgi:two-component system alkaline phosphatase synthesis response regulator PhoP
MLKQRVLVVDDDREVVRLMCAYLEKAGFEVLVAYNGETAIQILRRETPDLLLLDLMLPDRDGFDITRQLKSDPKLAHIPLIMLTARIRDTDKIVGLEMGADDYVTKPYNPREVVARVRARLRNQQSFQPQILQVGELELDPGRREVRVSGQSIDLTPTEYNLLHALMEHAGYVFTRTELISKGLGTDYEGIDRTLDSHIRNLRHKIEPDPKTPTYIHTIYGVGYRLEEMLS